MTRPLADKIKGLKPKNGDGDERINTIEPPSSNSITNQTKSEDG